MKTFLLFTQDGPILILSKSDSIQQSELPEKLPAYGKFVSWEIPVDSIKSCYSAHFEQVLKDPKQSDDLKVIDDNGEQVFLNISFKTLGQPNYHEGKNIPACLPSENKT